MTTADLLPALTRRDLRAFDDLQRRLVDDFQRAGWRGYVSKRGHVILHAPDGDRTASVSRAGRKRNYTNGRAELARWLRDRGGVTMTATTEIDETDESTATCEDCGRSWNGSRAEEYLASHRRNAHPEDPVVCSECGWPAASEGLLRAHRRNLHSGDHVCADCGRAFATASGLGGHRGGHTKALRAVAPSPDEAEPDAEAVVLAVVEPLLHVVEPPAEEPTTLAPDPVRDYLIGLPEGDDAEAMVAAIRGLVAAPLLDEIRTLRATVAELDAVRTELTETQARLAIIREAMGL